MGFSNLQTGFVVACPYVICAFAMVAWARSSDARGERVWHVVVAALLGAVGLAAAALLHANIFSLVALTVAAIGIYAALVSIWTLPSSILGGTAAAVPAAWRFERGGQESAIKLEPHFSTDENEGAIAAAAAGFGITSTSGWACRRELENGALVRLLPEWKLAGIPVYAYFPMGRATRAAARAAIDHLAAAFQRDPSGEPI